MSDTSGKSILDSNLLIAKFSATPQYLDINPTEIFTQEKRGMSIHKCLLFWLFYNRNVKMISTICL